MLATGLFTLLPLSLDLDSTSPERARSLASRIVVTSFVPSEPYTLRGATVVGSTASIDEVVRGAVLTGQRWDVTAGEAATPDEVSAEGLLDRFRPLERFRETGISSGPIGRRLPNHANE